jgi:hypothetical protein
MNVGVAAVSAMSEKNNFALVPRAPGTLEKADPGAKHILSGMVADTLALAHANVVAQSLSALGSPGITRGFFIGWFERGGKKTELLE